MLEVQPVSQKVGHTGFVGSWIPGADGGSRSQRRRLMAVLRMAHRVLGIDRKDLGVGSLGFGGGTRSVLLASASSRGIIGGLVAVAALGAAAPAHAQYSAGGGNATGTRAISIGSGSAAAGLDSVAEGTNSNATAQNAVAIGFGTDATAINAVALGSATVATAGARAQSAIAIGTDTTASQVDAIAMGRTALSSAQYGVAIGLNASATGAGGAVAIGQGTVSNNVNSVALGVQSNATGAGASALGTFAQATGGNSTAVGVGSNATNSYAWAGGYQSVASGDSSTAIGRAAGATGDVTTAVGFGAQATGNSSLALGSQATAIGVSTVAIGQGAGAASTTGNASSVAMGVAAGQFVSGAQNAAVGGGINGTMRGAGSGVTGARNVAFGTGDGGVTYDGTLSASAGSLVTGSDNVAIGTNAGIGVASNATTSIGYNAQASADNAIAMGNTAIADSADAVAIGTNSTATGGRAVAIGAGNTASGNGAVAIGDPNTATGNGAVASGLDNTATGNGSVAMGNTNMVGGGGQAVSVAGVAAQGAVGIGYQNTVIGQGSVAIGSTSSALAAGAIAFGDTAVANNAGDVALGSGSVTDIAVATTGTLINGTNYSFAGTAPASTVSVGAAGTERTITNVAAGRIDGSSTDAINGSQLFATNQAVEAIGQGWTVSAEGANATNVGVDSATGNSVDLNNADGNIVVTKSGASNDVTLDLADDVTLNSVTAGGTVLNTTGLTIAGGPSVTTGGIDAGGLVIANVAPGVAGTDAVNVSQLTTATSGLTTTGMNFTGNDASAGIVHRDLGQTLAIQGAATTAGTYSGGNLRTVTDPATGAINLQLADAPVFGTVTVNAGGSGKITGVAAGDVTAISTEAVNGSQLFAVQQSANAGWNISAQGANATNVAPGETLDLNNSDGNIVVSKSLASDNVTFELADDVTLNSVTAGGTVLNTSGLTIAGGPSVTTAGVDAGGMVITNVAPGAINAASTDAVNGSQLFATNTQVTQNTTDIANLDGRVTTVEGDVVNLDGRVTTIEGSLTNIGDTITEIAGDTSTAYTDANGDGIRYARTNETGLAETDAFAQGVGSTALGYQATATAGNAVAMGRGAQASIDGSLALGSGSVADRAIVPISGTIPAGIGFVPYNTTDATLLGAVSVGNAATSEYRQITNVADGTSAQDAVTLRQLQGAIGSVSVTPVLYFHANSAAVDSLAAGQESIAVGPTTVVNGDNGIGIGNGAIVQMTAPGGTAIGQNAQVSQADGIAFGTNSVANGIQSIAIGPGANASFSGSVALGAGATTSVGSQTGYAAYGLTAPQNSAGEVSVGSAGAERQITNVAAGSAATDAVNVSQLQAVDSRLTNEIANLDNLVTNVENRVTTVEGNVANLGDSVANSFGGNSTYDPTTGTVTTELNVGGNTYNNVNDALTALNTTASAGWNIQADGGPATNIGSNGTLNVTAGSNTVVTLNGNELQIAMADNPTFSGVINANGGLTVGANTTVNMGGNVVQNVAAGAVNATSTDAVNGSQLNQVQQVANNSVQYDADRTTVTFNPGGSATRLQNVAAGVAPTDAVNVQQLNDGLAGTLASANAYTDTRLAGVEFDLSQNRRDANAGTAGALAAAGLPQAFEAGRGMLSIGAGTYQGQSAVALGLSRVMDDGRTVIKAGASYDTQSRVGANVGVGLQF